MGDTLALEKHRTLVVRCFSFPNRGGGAVIKANMKKLILLVAFVLFVLSAVFYNDGRATGSAFFGDHTASRCDEENANFVYTDKQHHLILSYPRVFSDKGVVDKNGYVYFAARQDGAKLQYWVTPNTYRETPAAFMERVTAEKSQELEGNVVIGKIESLDQKTGVVTPCTYYWVVDREWIANVAILCSSSKEASNWYQLLKEGAVSIESIADAGLKQKKKP